MLNKIETNIITAMARTLWLLAWADYQEQVKENPLRGEIADQAPETPESVIRYAHYVAGKIHHFTGGKAHDSLFFTFREALRADALNLVKGDEAITAYIDKFQDSKDLQDRFGHCLAMMVTGQGVSWFDNHEEFPLRVPRIEFSYLDLSDEELEG